MASYVNSRCYYNLRKRFGYGIARTIMNYWYYYNVDPPEDQDMALEYFILKRDIK